MGFPDDEKERRKEVRILMGQNVNENKAMTKVVIAEEVNINSGNDEALQGMGQNVNENKAMMWYSGIAVQFVLSK